MEHVASYPTVYQLGHKSIVGIFDLPVLVEEKIDGSQFSFGILNGEYQCRSHKKQMIPDAPEKMFNKAVANTKDLPLHEGWIYRGEYLEKPHHNTLSYDRTPEGNVIIFDIMTGPEIYMSYDDKVAEAHRIGLECVPRLFIGKVENFEIFKTFLDMTSKLGGTTIEGVVIKNYELMTQEKKPAMGKYVSEKFKEEHSASWKERNPSGKDYVEIITESLRVEARWNKSIIHMKEEGLWTGTPQDIGYLIKAISEDIAKEEGEAIKDRLFAHFWPIIKRGVTRGFPEFYKELLAKSAFGDTIAPVEVPDDVRPTDDK
jgi:hypothetical protein